jgi:hypothetical protein
MVCALLVDGGLFAYVSSGFHAMAWPTKRLQVELGVATAIDQRHDMIELRFNDRVQRRAAILASLAAAMINAVFDVRGDLRLVGPANPFSDGAAHRTFRARVSTVGGSSNSESQSRDGAMRSLIQPTFVKRPRT